jgi:formate-dependent nitrite reductase membrane component NrfD
MPSETEIERQPIGRWEQPATPLQSESLLDKALKTFNGDDSQGGPSYYDISMLKPPVWTPEVGIYFFLGGLSSGAYTMARLGERLGGDRYRTLTRVGTVVAAAAALPCAPLLIKDLGDPRRFHHMLRVWKPDSPMNLGSWTLTGYSGIVLLAGLREWLRARRKEAPFEGTSKTIDGIAEAVADLGVPLGLLLAGYTGVLLSTTSVPIWGRNPWIGALFSAGAVSSGASAVRLALAATPEGTDGAAGKALSHVEKISHVTEAATIVGYLASAGKFAEPLTKGPESGRFWGGAVAAGLVLPTILGGLPVPQKAHKVLSLVASAAAVMGVMILRASVVSAGRPSANNPEAARQASRRKEEGGIA